MPSDASLRWSVIGVGTAGLARIRAIGADPRSRLVVVWRGRNAERAVAARQARDLEDALTGVDVVAICSPDAAHPDQVEAALRAGRHVVCEYPLAPTEERAAALFDLATRAGRVLHVEHIELLHAPQVILRSHTRRDPVTRLHIAFSRPGAEGLGRAEVAMANLARLHRVVDLCGPVERIASLDAAPGLVSGAFVHRDGAESTFRWEQSPYLSRETRIDLTTAGGARWELRGDSLFRDGNALTLIESDPLFEQDHRNAVGRILEGRKPYVEEDRIRHVLHVRGAIAGGRVGPLSPR